MPVNWSEIALVLAINLSILATISLYMKYRGIPKLLAKCEIWMGGAIGRFMQNLAKKASEEEGEEGSQGTGVLNIAGFKIDAGTIKAFAEILKVVQSFGFLKNIGKSGGVGEHPFLKS